LLTARLLLKASLEDRNDNINPPKNNHMSKHVVGSIVLLIAGFESWVNEVLSHLSIYDPSLRKLGKDSLVKKYRKLCAWDGAGHMSLADVANLAQVKGLDLDQVIRDLELVIEVRHEIVHPMPFPTGTQWNVPSNLLRLHQMGLLISTGQSDSDYTFCDKLRSYALGYWCWEVVETCADLLVEHLKPDQQAAWTARNFSAYKDFAL
ncbi:MAG: hypothetical protein ACRD5H_11505, partial [Nitrososphaerales archaeon]